MEEAKNRDFCSVWRKLKFCGCTGDRVVNSAPDLGCGRAGKICGLGWGPWGEVRVPWVEGEGVLGRGVSMTKETKVEKGKAQRPAG